MLESLTRVHFERYLIEPIAKKLQALNVTPNQVTLISLLLGFLTIPFLGLGIPVLAFISLILSGVADTLDGSLARISGQSTPFGSALDIICDRIVEFSVCFGLLLVAPAERAIPIALLQGSILICISAFLVIGIFSENTSEKSFHYNPGLIERAEAFIGFSLMMLFPDYFTVICYSLTALILLTAVLHLKQFKAQV